MIDTCRRSVADQLIVPPVCDRIHRSLTVHSRVWMLACLFCCTCEYIHTYGCCVFLSQVTLLHGVGVSTPSGIPGKSPKLCSSTVTHAGDAGTVSQFHSRFIPHNLIYSALLHLTACVFLCVFFPSLMQRDKSCHSVVEITAFFK